MPKGYSAAAREVFHRTSPTDFSVICLRIEHPLMPSPACVVNDTDTIATGPGGFAYIAAPFNIVLPDERERELPGATIEIDNIGRDLTDWVAASRGGRDATIHIIVVRRSAPTVIEDSYVMSVRTMSVATEKITVVLTYENFLNLSAVAGRHDTRHSPGLF